MILTGPEVAYALENAEARHLALQVETYRGLTKREGVHTLEMCGGIAALTENIFGRKLNHVTGFGMGTPVSADAVEQLEAVYNERALDVEIDLCPHADGTALAVLMERGYAVNAFSNTYVRMLIDEDLTARPPNGIEIVTDRAIVEDVFVSHSIAGFEMQAVRRSPLLLEALAKIAIARADTMLFAARLNGQLAGTGGMSVIATPVGKIAHLYIASTHPAHRGRGIQLALIRSRLAAARNAGCTMASITARPYNTSARNTERAGFSLAYTKATFVKRYSPAVQGDSLNRRSSPPTPA
ncbi:GNAT family N-acetyltransferase [Paraburkholderia sediminicola]|uniref:GNAT family N-acetyltransferase n=1 Tax=Paraburkholderia sediminicola TaxID=458836 RepID=UPI0038B8769D